MKGIPPPGPAFHDALDRGIALFNGQQFFAAHEVWEEAWRTHAGEPSHLLQGLIQVAAGFVKLQRGEPRGAFANLDKGSRKLEAFLPGRFGLDLAALLASVAPWIATAETMIASGGRDYDPAGLPRLLRTPD